MFLHVTPQFFTDVRGRPACELVRLEIPELGVSLRGGGVDFKTVNPYPNKRYRVASPLGRKSCSGLLFEVDQLPAALSYVASWSVDAERLVTHKVHITVADYDHEVVSDCIPVWACQLGRAPELPSGLTMTTAQPRMDFDTESGRLRGAVDRVDRGWVVHREERLRSPSAALSSFSRSRPCDKLPAFDQAFRVPGR